jgi:crotonobetainyl-CoA:carnitine CoA-transferase CaiB-like acyl-CoA transferase
VLDLSSTLGGLYAAHLLAAGGAQVVRVESPGGHPLGRWSASGAVIGDGDQGALFRWLTGGRAPVAVDPANESQVATVFDLARTADAVLWTRGSPLTEDGPFRIEAVRTLAPDAAVTAITPFGLSGPWSDRPATEFTLQALSGGPALRGSRHWPPLSTGGQHGEYMAGAFGALATLIGLRQRLVSGDAPLLDVSALEAVIMTQLFNPITMETIAPPGRGYAVRAKARVADIVASKDGWVGFAVVNRVSHWHAFCRMIGRPDWAEDRTLDPVANRFERAEELNGFIEAWAGARTTAEIVELATGLRIPSTEVGNGATIPVMEHFAADGFYQRNSEGGFLQPAPPFRFHPPLPDTSGQGCDSGDRPSPAARTVGAAGLAGPQAPHHGARRPLEGLRVADFTSFWAGPFMAHTLAMFGADVIHVESPGFPDGARLMNLCPRTEPRWWEWSPYFQATNTNKRSLALDMDHEDGRAVARRLIANCDVLVENFRPRVMERWGLSWDEVRAIRPDVLMVRMPAFGLTGPWRDRSGFAMTMEQVSGMAWMTGLPDGPPSSLFGPCDPSAGVHAAIATLIAIEQRRRDGAGRLVEVPMVGQALNVAGEQVIEHSAYGALLMRDGNRGAAAAPQGCYRTATPDEDGEGRRWVAIAVATDEQWEGLRSALGHPAWAGAADLDHASGRRRRHDELDEELERWCALRPLDEIVERLSASGVPVAPVVHPIEQLGFEQLYARQFFETVEHPVTGGSTHVTFPFALPQSSGPVHRRPAPSLGQHNAEVLAMLGFSDAEIHDLEERGVVGDRIDG